MKDNRKMSQMQETGKKNVYGFTMCLDENIFKIYRTEHPEFEKEI